MSVSEYSCKICCSEVKDTHLAVLYDLCETWIHPDSASIGETQYQNLKERLLARYCPYCIMEFPFSLVKKKDLHILLKDSSHNNHPQIIQKKKKKMISQKGFVK